jgi:chaperonin GroEL (HSP60 family)
LAVEKYADAVESIPLVLAENAGMSIMHRPNYEPKARGLEN